MLWLNSRAHQTVVLKQRFPHSARTTLEWRGFAHAFSLCNPSVGFQGRFEAFVSASQNHVSRLRRPALAETGWNAASVGRKAEHLALLRPLSRQGYETGDTHAVWKPAIDSSCNQIGGEEGERNSHVDLPGAATLTACNAVGGYGCVHCKFIKPTASAGNSRH